VGFAIWVLFFLAAKSMRALPQHTGHDAAGPVPREILERPLPLRQGIGKVHEAVTTSSPEAQAFYDQGLAYLNSFVWIEAARSFHQALRLDPCLGMAQLGLSEPAVRVALHRLRQRYRQLLRDEIAQTVARVEDVDDELRLLLGALAG